MPTTDKIPLYRTTFLGQDFPSLLREIADWLDDDIVIKVRNLSIHHNKMFFFSEFVINYDNEIGYIIDIYHSEMKNDENKDKERPTRSGR